MEHYVAYQTTDDDKTYEKWFVSMHYKISAQHLIDLIEKHPGERDRLIIPLILTLAAWLEATLNDHLTIDTFRKHGSQRYKKIAEGYRSITFKKKLRVTVPVLTDNAFQLRDDTKCVQLLDHLIDYRNALIHPHTLFVEKKGVTVNTPGRHAGHGHPLFHLKTEECKELFEAVDKYEQLFFGQYDSNRIVANEILTEIPAVMERIDHLTDKPKG